MRIPRSFGLASCLLAIGALRAGQAPSPREIRILVVERGTGAVVSGADVVSVGSRLCGAESQRLGRRLEGAELDAWVERAGSHTATGSRGEAAIGIAERALVQVRAGDLFGMAEIEPDAPQPFRFELDLDVAARVQVVDAEGQPVEGVSVSLMRSLGEPPHEMLAPIVAPVATRGREGIASFPHLQLRDPGIREAKGVLKLAIPLATDVREDVDFASVGRRPLALQLPPTGSVVLTLAESDGACARLRRRDGHEREHGMRPNADTVDFVSGRAEFPFVGLALEFETEIHLPGVGAPIRSACAGPVSPGQMVLVPITATGATVEIRGRVLDDESKPLANQQLCIDVGVESRRESGLSMQSLGSFLDSDGEGRFRMRIPRDIADGATRHLLVRKSWRAEPTPSPELEASLRVELPQTIEVSTLDVGDVRITAPASPRRFAQLSEDELAGALRDELHANTLQHDRQLDGLLCEVVRRGGASWVAVLAEEWNRAQADDPLSRFSSHDVSLLTALRRAQKRPDPVTMDLHEGALLAFEFPDRPVLRFELTNVDPDAAAMMLAGAMPESHLDSLRVEVRTPEGTPVQRREIQRLGRTGAVIPVRIARGESAPVSIDVSETIGLPGPGIYEARVQYHDQESITYAQDLGNLITVSTGWIRFEIRPRPLVLTRAEKARTAELVAAWKENEPVRRIEPVYQEGWVIAADAEPRLDETLWSFGWKAVPALLDALDDAATTANKRAWVLVQLYDLTGWNEPSRTGGVIGAYSYVESSQRNGEVHFTTVYSQALGAPDADAQRAHAELWRPLRAGFRVEVRD